MAPKQPLIAEIEHKPLKYQPRAPAKRLKDRVPKPPPPPEPKDEDAMDIDDGDYIYDTFIKDDTIMTDALGNPTTPSGTANIGVIILQAESEADILDEFINEGASDSDEYYTDDEDENAENYYGADYPEDELSESEEGEGGNAYKYFHGDEEEWDFERDGEVWSEGEGSGDEVEGLMYPWKKR